MQTVIRKIHPGWTFQRRMTVVVDPSCCRIFRYRMSPNMGCLMQQQSHLSGGEMGDADVGSAAQVDDVFASVPYVVANVPVVHWLYSSSCCSYGEEDEIVASGVLPQQLHVVVCCCAAEWRIRMGRSCGVSMFGRHHHHPSECDQYQHRYRQLRMSDRHHPCVESRICYRFHVRLQPCAPFVAARALSAARRHGTSHQD